jgi:hypothetical protein
MKILKSLKIAVFLLAALPMFAQQAPIDPTQIGDVDHSMILGYGMCEGGTPKSSWSLPSANPVVPHCTADSQEGNLQIDENQLAYYDLVVPDNFVSFEAARMNFTTTDVTVGHTIVLTLAAKCIATTGAVLNPNNPTYNTAATATDTIAGGAISGSVRTVTFSGLSMTGCSPGYKLRLRISRTAGTSTDTAVELTGGLLFTYKGPLVQ